MLLVLILAAALWGIGYLAGVSRTARMTSVGVLLLGVIDVADTGGHGRFDTDLRARAESTAKPRHSHRQGPRNAVQPILRDRA